MLHSTCLTEEEREQFDNLLDRAGQIDGMLLDRYDRESYYNRKDATNRIAVIFAGLLVVDGMQALHDP